MICWDLKFGGRVKAVSYVLLWGRKGCVLRTASSLVLGGRLFLLQIS